MNIDELTVARVLTQMEDPWKLQIDGKTTDMLLSGTWDWHKTNLK
jgi:hypothetical protein